EVAALPPRTARLPVHRVLGGCVAAPFPPVDIPQFPASVPAVLDERGVLGLGDRCAGEAERLYLDRVGPLLVVVHESGVAVRAQQERATGNVRVAGEGACLLGVNGLDSRQRRGWIRQG